MTADPTPAPTATPTWRDRKRYLWLLGSILPMLPVAGWGLVRAAASVVWSYEDGDTYATLNVPLRCAQILAALI